MEDKMKAFEKVAKDLGLDLVVFYGIPWIRNLFSGRPTTKEDKVVLEEAREYIRKGDKEKAKEVLAAHLFGVGMADEEILDEDFSAVVRAGLASTLQVQQLQTWLSGNTPAKRRLRRRFRHALMLQKSPRSRLEVIADYAKLPNNRARNTRMEATGKLELDALEVVWNWLTGNIPAMVAGAAKLLSATVTRVAGAAGIAGTGLGGAANATGRAIAVAARAVGNAAVATGGAIRDGAAAADNQLDAWGLQLQAAYPPPPATTGRLSRVWEWFVNQHR